MHKWKAIYQDKALSENWEGLPDGLLAVIIYRNGVHRLIGADYYWVQDDSYGMIYDGSCCDPGHSWWKSGIRMNTSPPETIMLKAGLMLPDKEWQTFIMERLDALT